MYAEKCSENVPLTKFRIYSIVKRQCDPSTAPLAGKSRPQMYSRWTRGRPLKKYSHDPSLGMDYGQLSSSEHPEPNLYSAEPHDVTFLTGLIINIFFSFLLLPSSLFLSFSLVWERCSARIQPCSLSGLRGLELRQGVLPCGHLTRTTCPKYLNTVYHAPLPPIFLCHLLPRPLPSII